MESKFQHMSVLNTNIVAGLLLVLLVSQASGAADTEQSIRKYHGLTDPTYSNNLGQKDPVMNHQESSGKTDEIFQCKNYPTSNIQTGVNSSSNQPNRYQNNSDSRYLNSTAPPPLDIRVEDSSNAHYSGTNYNYPGMDYKLPGSEHLHLVQRSMPYTPPSDSGYHTVDSTHSSTNNGSSQPSPTDRHIFTNDDAFSSYDDQTPIMNDQYMDMDLYIDHPGLPNYTPPMFNPYSTQAHCNAHKFSFKEPPPMRNIGPDMPTYEPNQPVQNGHSFPCECDNCLLLERNRYYHQYIQKSQLYASHTYQSNITGEQDWLPNRANSSTDKDTGLRKR
eukprot:115152_1